MSLARFAKRRDQNEAEIVKALRRIGAVVWQLDTPADLLVGHHGQFFTLEVKDGALSPSRRALTPLETTYALICQDHGLPHRVVVSLEEALAAVLGES